jgi:2-polyprenyl-3-methyl-5-hydroxy-6-metoxy-1,4-benzoquinol methylase
MSFEKETGRDLYFAQLEKELAELIDPDTGLLDEKYAIEVDCPVCHSRENKTLFIKRGYTFVRCFTCGMIYTNPQVKQKIVNECYKGESYSTELWMDVLKNTKETEWRQDYYNSILEHIENIVGKGSLLDVGCAVGHFLDIARTAGWETTGLELSETGHRYCTENLNLNVLNKTIEESELPKESFDAITLIGVLEHITDPIDIIESCKKLLKKGGLICVIVPNVYSLINMVIHQEAVTFDGRNHLLYFSTKTLTNLFEKLNIEVLLSDTVLTGAPNLWKYLQYNDPYSEGDGSEYLPEKLKVFCDDVQGQKDIEAWILKMNLGLRLRLIGKK